MRGEDARDGQRAAAGSVRPPVTMSEVDARMRALEERWFAVAKEAKRAREDLETKWTIIERREALRRLEEAEGEKRRLMAAIEALEDGLIE